MAVVNQPPILVSSFAANGDKNTIPATNSGTEGLASLSLGFPSITSQPVSQGGIPPQREDFNGIFNLITSFLMFLQNGSIFAYSNSLDYQPPAIVYGNNALYKCVATNGANTSAGVQPLSNTAYWKPLIPVGAITIFGNVITITNETGAQTQYTIDTINNPPLQSDSSNKIVTSAWVKAYAPSKTGTGASGTWGINISGNANTSTNSAYAGNINQGFANNDVPFPKNDFRSTVLNAPDAGFCTRPFACKFPDNTSYSISGIAFGAGDTHGFLQCGYSTPKAFVGGGISNNINWYKQLAFSDGTGASGTWNINISGNANTATKATQDKNGLEIDTGYLKLSGGTMTGSITLNVLNGEKYVRDNNNVGILFSSGLFGFWDWRDNQNILYYSKDSKTLSIGRQVTAPTPNTSDNSTKVATTAFVKSLFTANKQENGWWKDNNTGLLIQWGTITAGDIESSYIVYGEGTFPLTFSTVFQVVVCHQGGAPTGNCISYLSNNKIKIKLGTNGVTPQYTPWDCRYIAIGVA